jgi:hypothetical protein
MKTGASLPQEQKCLLLGWPLNFLLGRQLNCYPSVERNSFRSPPNAERNEFRSTMSGKRKNFRSTKKTRKGAVLSLELLLLFPVLWVVCFGFVEFSLLLIGMQRVQAASNAACRMGTLPTTDLEAQQTAMNDAAKAALGRPTMVASYQMQSQVGQYSGDPVQVEISVPMTSAAPNLLLIVGFNLEGRQLVARTEMCKQ